MEALLLSYTAGKQAAQVQAETALLSMPHNWRNTLSNALNGYWPLEDSHSKAAQGTWSRNAPVHLTAENSHPASLSIAGSDAARKHAIPGPALLRASPCIDARSIPAVHGPP